MDVSIRGKVSECGIMHFSGATEIASLKMVEGNSDMDQTLIELAFQFVGFGPDLLQDVVARKILPSIEQGDRFQPARLRLACLRHHASVPLSNKLRAPVVSTIRERMSILSVRIPRHREWDNSSDWVSTSANGV